MKQLLLTLIYSMSFCLLIAQDEEKTIFRTWYMNPVQGQSVQLEKGLKDHVKKFHGEGKWPEYYF